MKITKDMLDKQVSEFEENALHNMTYREFIVGWEDHLGIENADLDNMTDEELTEYDDWIFEMSLK